MGELFDAIKSEAAKRPNHSTEAKLRTHLGTEGWKDFEKACLDKSFSTAVICRAVKASGLTISHTAMLRIRNDIQKQAEQ